MDIDYQTGTVYVDGEALDEPYLNEPMEEPWYEDLTSVTVPEGSVFVMGDNRNHSNDSRDVTLGTVDTRYLLGKAEFICFPLLRLRTHRLREAAAPPGRGSYNRGPQAMPAAPD